MINPKHWEVWNCRNWNFGTVELIVKLWNLGTSEFGTSEKLFKSCFGNIGNR